MANMFSKLRGAVGTLLRGVGNLLNGGAGEVPVVTVSRRSAGRRAAAVRVVAVAGALVLGAALVTGFTACDDGTDDGGGSTDAKVDTALVAKWYESQENANAGGDCSFEITDNGVVTGSGFETSATFSCTTTYTTSGTGTISIMKNYNDGSAPSQKVLCKYSVNGTKLTLSDFEDGDGRFSSDTYYKKASGGTDNGGAAAGRRSAGPARLAPPSGQ